MKRQTQKTKKRYEDVLNCFKNDKNQELRILADKINHYIETNGITKSRMSAAFNELTDIISGVELKGKNVVETVESIKNTIDDKDHWYGVKFEKAIPYLIKKIY